ncbi:hypothetical protein ABH975_003430 [Bradyrhizobium ottawaense]|uniref:hypothetical protein n=1 Tax=Bradyrhizobium ottawaense TaxID=931866 RepID=UPI003518E8C3
MGSKSRRSDHVPPTDGGKLNRFGDMPLDEIHAEKMQRIARRLDHIFNGNKRGSDRDWGFALMLFPFNGMPGNCNYISNGNRAQMIELLKEQVKRFEAKAREVN